MPQDRLIRQYTAMASHYDRRWSGYLAASLGMTMAVVEGLPRARVLDVACGTGLLLERLAHRAGADLLVGVDRVSAMLDVGRARNGGRISLLAADAARLPFRAAAFDLVVSTSALHYFPQATAALRDMRRVIAPHGNLVITDWCRDFATIKLLDRVLPWTPDAHVRAFTSDELAAQLARAGFAVVSVETNKIDWLWGLMTIHAIPA